MQAIDFGTGFQSGFNTVDNHFQQNRALDQRDAALAEATKRADQNYAINTEQLDITRQNAAADQKYREDTLAQRKSEAEATADYRGSQLAISATNANISGSKERRELRAEAYANLQNRAKAEFARAVTTGEIDPTFQQEVIKAGYPELSVNYWAQDQNLNANLALRAPLVAAAKGDYSQVNTPESLAAFNQVYAPQVQIGIGEVSQATGKKITSKEIAGFKLAPGETTPDGDQGVVTMLKVTYEDGTSDLQPVTLNRSSATDDNVAINSVGTMLDDVQGRVRMAEIFSRPEVRSSMAAAQRTLFGDEAKNDATANQRDIDDLVARGMTQEQAIATIYPPKGEADDSALIKNVKFRMDNGESYESAIAAEGLGKMNPGTIIAGIVKAEIENSVFNKGDPDSDDYVPPETTEQIYARVSKMVNDSMRQGGGSDSPAPTPDKARGNPAPQPTAISEDAAAPPAAPAAAAPTPAPAQASGGDPEVEKRLKILRANPKNEKYTDDQLRQAIQQKLGGKQ